MSNEYFVANGAPAQGSALQSAAVRSELSSVEAGFDKLPTMTGNGNKLVRVNSGGTALEALSTAAITSSGLTQSTARLLGRTTATTGAVEEITVSTDLSLASGALSFSPSYAFSFRNKIIGGDFTTNPWQRGTSFTAPASGAYTADRFSHWHSNDGVVNVLKTADAPTAAEAGVYTQHCLHVDVTTADASIAAGQYYLLWHLVEGYNAAAFGFGQAGTRYVTLSFWHKHTKTGTYCVAFRNSASDRSYVAEYVQDVTDTWEKAVITIPVDTSGTWLYDNGIGLRVVFAVASGSTFQTTANTWTAGNYLATANQVNALDSTSNNFKIALVQLEAGSTATPFETRPVGVELALCQRYFQDVTSRENTANYGYYGVCHNRNAGSATLSTYELSVKMRTAPTFTLVGAASDWAVFSAGGAITASAVTSAVLHSQHVVINATAAGTVADTAGMLYSNRTAATTSGFQLSAEL